MVKVGHDLRVVPEVSQSGPGNVGRRAMIPCGRPVTPPTTIRRIGAEIDAHGHLAPKAMAFKATMREHGVKHAFQQRDSAFGSGLAAVRGRDPD
jgi:enoyl-CoA hydratase